MIQQNILLQSFIKFTIGKLQTLKQITFTTYPNIVLTVHKNKVDTLASFNPSTNEIICYTPKRLVADVFRSIAHEMAHFAQNMKQELGSNSGSTGSRIENEANAIAGVILREFTEQYPEILTTSFEEIMKQTDSNVRDKYEKMLNRKYDTTMDKIDANTRNDRDAKSMINEYAKKMVDNLVIKYTTENPNVTDKIANEYIDRFKEVSGSPKVTQKDILQYSFAELKKLVDSFKTKTKSSNNDVVFSDTELVYSKQPLQILHGDSPKQCIKIKGDFSASWCIARTTGNMYNNYRFGDAEPSFYFVKNLERLNKIKGLNDDPYCFFVVQINNEGKFIVTSALNDGDKELSWQHLVEIEPLLQGTEKLFTHNALSDTDRDNAKRFKGGISDDKYKNLSYDEKNIYTSITNELNDNKFENTPDEILNDYITMGADLTDIQLDFIQNKKSLLNNYRRVTIKYIIPDVIKRNLTLGNRWLMITDNEAIELYGKLEDGYTSEVLLYKPSLIKYFVGTLGKNDINDSNVSKILIRNPQLIKYFKNENRLSELPPSDMSDILKVQPTLIKYFEDYLNKIRPHAIAKILTTQPKLIKFFESRLEDIEYHHIVRILTHSPILVKYFTEELLDFSSGLKSTLLHSQPQLAKYFNKTQEDEISELVQLGSKHLNECECEIDTRRKPKLSESKSDTGCLMLDLKFNNWNKFLKQIPDDILYTDEEGHGKETEPHCTVLYGFDASVDVDKIKKSLQTLKSPIKVSLNKINLFENEKFDVIKFNVVSTELNKLHKIFKDNFKNNEVYDKYEPHVTIAYVKKGMGKKFMTNNFEPIELESGAFTYSLGKGGEKVKVQINQEDTVNELIKLGSELLNECDCDDIEDDEINELITHITHITHITQETISEGLYQGKSVTLNKPTRGDTKKFKVYVKNKSGKIVKVNFGSKDYNIKKNNPDRKKSYCARSKGIAGGGKDKTKANYWSRRAWKC